MEVKNKESLTQISPCYDEDEIDLYELWLILKKRWKYVFGTTLLFIIAAVIYIFAATPIYKIDFSVKLPIDPLKEKLILSAQETKVYLNNLNSLIENHEYGELSKKLKLDKKLLKHLVKVNANTQRGDTSFVSISVDYKDKDPKFENSIANAILNYLNSNPLLQEKIKLEKDTLLQNIQQTQKKLEELSKLRQLIIKRLKNSRGNIIGFNVVDIENLIYVLEISLDDYKSKLKELKGYTILTSPSIPTKPYKPKKALILAVASVSGLFLGIFIAFFVEWIENVRKRYDNLNTGETK